MHIHRTLFIIAVSLSLALQAAAAEHAQWTMTITPQDGPAARVSVPDPSSDSGVISRVSHVETMPGGALITPAMASRNVTQRGAVSGGALSYADYRRVYASIPFSRTEYDANPGYRHEATMELLLGELRPRIVAPASSGTTVRVNVGWPIRGYSPWRSGYRPYSQYPWH